MNGDWPPSTETYYLRCDRVPLKRLLPGEAEIAFFESSACRRQYALQPGTGLTYRWGHPISLALYSVIFDENPVNEEKASLAAHDLIEGRPRKEIEKMLDEIELELSDPVQKVRDILDCRASEEWPARTAAKGQKATNH